MFHICKDEAAKEAVSIPASTPDGGVHAFQLPDLGKKHSATRLILCTRIPPSCRSCRGLCIITDALLMQLCAGGMPADLLISRNPGTMSKASVRETEEQCWLSACVARSASIAHQVKSRGCVPCLPCCRAMIGSRSPTNGNRSASCLQQQACLAPD